MAGVAFAVVIAILFGLSPGSETVGIAWGAPTLLETHWSFAHRIDLAMDSSGRAIAVWEQVGETGDPWADAWASVFIPGTGWGAATQLDTDPGGNAYRVRVAMDGLGNAFAVWLQDYNPTGESGTDLWASRFEPSTGWGVAKRLAVGAWPALVAADAGGGAIVAWTDDAPSFDLWVRHFSLVGGWGDTIRLADHPYPAYPVDLAMTPSGDAMVFWENYDGARYNIFASRYVASVGWEASEPVENDDAPYPVEVRGGSLAMDDGGRALATWRVGENMTVTHWANSFLPGMGWGTPVALAPTLLGNESFARVSMSPSGNGTAVWLQHELSRPEVWAARYTPGVGWDPPEIIGTGSAGTPSIAMDDDGNGVAVWADQDAWANWYEAGVGWGVAQMIDREAGVVNEITVAMKGLGDPAAVWAQWDDTSYSVFGAVGSVRSPHPFEMATSAPPARGDVVVRFGNDRPRSSPASTLPAISGLGLHLPCA